MEVPQALPSADTINRYLSSDNDRIKKLVGMVANNVISAAKQAALTMVNDRDRVSDIADYLDGEFISQLNMEQSAEIDEIAKISKELQRYFDTAIMRLAFRGFNDALLKHAKELEKRAAELRERELNIEKIISKRLSELKKQITRDSGTARGFFESALAKAEKVFDQNKITRFAYSSISIFQEEFFELQGSHDVEHITKLYQRAIEPFQITKMVMEKDGKLRKIITNQFTEDCSQDLFLFFYKYYNELVEIYQSSGELPSTADELSRIFERKKKDISEIIYEMQRIDKTA